MNVKKNNVQVLGASPGGRQFQFALTYVVEGDHWRCMPVSYCARRKLPNERYAYAML